MTDANDTEHTDVDLNDRLRELERKVEEQKQPWYKRASDVFSLLAVAVAAVSIIISMMAQHEQAAGEDRRHLSAIFNEIGSVNAEMAKLLALPLRDDQKEFAGYALNNQLWTLLQDADRLAQKFKDDLSPLELAVLGANFGQIAEIEKAEEYLNNLLQAEVNPIQKATGYRSLANLIALKGEAHFGAAYGNFAKAIAALHGIKSLHAGRELANIHIMQARLYIAEHKTDEARKSLRMAWTAIRSLPCIEELAYIAEAARRYAKIVQAPESAVPQKHCAYIDGPLAGTDIASYIGKYQLTDGTPIEIIRTGAGLEVRLPGQQHKLGRIKEGILEFLRLPGYFILFEQLKDQQFQSFRLYQPNGVYAATRI